MKLLYCHFPKITISCIYTIPRTNNCGNSPGVRWARANTAALTMIATGVGTLQ